MKVLVINAGSSSLKYQLIDMNNEETIAKGNCERIGLDNSFLTYKTAEGINKTIETEMATHTEAFAEVKKALLNEEYGVIKNIDEVADNENRSRSELIREALRSYIHKNKVRNTAYASKNAQLLEALLD